MKKYFNLVIFSIIFLILNSCKPLDVPAGTPQCIKNKIRKIQKESVTSPPTEIWQYKFQDKIVYYIPPLCCEQFSELYDSKCNLLGHPDGGFSGGGDGVCCPGFFQERTDAKLIWKDSR